MAHGKPAFAETTEPESDSGQRVRHPLFAAIARAPLDPISDELNAELDEIAQKTERWLSTEEFVAEVGLGRTR